MNATLLIPASWLIVAGLVLLVLTLIIAGSVAAPMQSGTKCPICNAVTNVPSGYDSFECWQCKNVVPVSTRRSLPIWLRPM